MEAINKRRALILSTLLFLLTACPPLDQMQYPSYEERVEFLAKYDLTYDYVSDDYKEVREFTTIIPIEHTFLEETKIIKSSDEMKNFLDDYSQNKEEDYDEEIYTLLSSLDNKNFDEYNLIISETIGCHYRAFEHYFQTIFIKDNTLFIYLLYHDYVPEGSMVTCVVGYEYLPIYVKKSVTFDKVEFIIQDETSYRKR